MEGLKTVWEKEKMLITSIFSFSHNVFKSPLCQGHLESGLYGKGLMEQSCFCMTLKMKAFEYSVEKAENGGN